MTVLVAAERRAKLKVLPAGTPCWLTDRERLIEREWSWAVGISARVLPHMTPSAARESRDCHHALPGWGCGQLLHQPTASSQLAAAPSRASRGWNAVHACVLLSGVGVLRRPLDAVRHYDRCLGSSNGGPVATVDRGVVAFPTGDVVISAGTTGRTLRR